VTNAWHDDGTDHFRRTDPAELEPMQVLRYGKGQFYGAHTDFFDGNDPNHDPGWKSMMDLDTRDRFATVFMYLNTVPPAEGASTYFPAALSDQTALPMRGLHTPPSYFDCEQGTKVDAVKGSVLLFYSQTPDGLLDELSQVKRIATLVLARGDTRRN
jgi:prolyl 4-hydroxylase